MTTVEQNDTAAYINILEAIVAVVAIKAGLNPNTMMANALRDITESAGMGTVDSERIIQQRWTGRNLQASALAARLLEMPTDDSSEEQATEATEPVETPDMRSRLQAYKQRQSEGTTEPVSENSS